MERQIQKKNEMFQGKKEIRYEKEEKRRGKKESKGRQRGR